MKYEAKYRNLTLILKMTFSPLYQAIRDADNPPVDIGWRSY